jgi:hypothetical protein
MVDLGDFPSFFVNQMLQTTPAGRPSTWNAHVLHLHGHGCGFGAAKGYGNVSPGQRSSRDVSG